MGTGRASKIVISAKVNGMCFWCGKDTKMYPENRIQINQPDGATVDHIFPLKFDERQTYKRKHKPSPIVLSCNKCNQDRGNTSFEKFYKRMILINPNIDLHNIIVYENKWWVFLDASKDRIHNGAKNMVCKLSKTKRK